MANRNNFQEPRIRNFGTGTANNRRIGTGLSLEMEKGTTGTKKEPGLVKLYTIKICISNPGVLKCFKI